MAPFCVSLKAPDTLTAITAGDLSKFKSRINVKRIGSHLSMYSISVIPFVYTSTNGVIITSAIPHIQKSKIVKTVSYTLKLCSNFLLSL